MKIALIGYGKMGKAVEKLALAKGHDIVLRITQGNHEELKGENLKMADVAIEFSLPSTAFHNIAACLKNNLPVVSGTTGWLGQMPAIKELCRHHDGGFFYASNFSVGVNLLFSINRVLAKFMKHHRQYDVSIEEIHHTQKLDYPSGTALTLAEGIIENSSIKQAWTADLTSDNRQVETKEEENKLVITSKRINSIPGSHYVKWSSPIDQIEISHVAHSREGFAMGAVSAAEWIIGKKGVFGMNDLLGFST